MPRYFFHLSFGQRVVPDEEGVELPSRSAARDEALAVVRDLANPERGRNSRRWASWFIEVADENGGFFRTPIGHPALELVTPNTPEARVEGEEPAAIVFGEDTAVTTHTAEIVWQMWTRRERMAQLLTANEQLRRELSSVYLVSESIRVRSCQLVSLARVTRD